VSRVISGCHWQSDVDASRPIASMGYARLQTSQEFQKQMLKAQAEYKKALAHK
jgi:acid phosphatase (class A)